MRIQYSVSEHLSSRTHSHSIRQMDSLAARSSSADDLSAAWPRSASRPSILTSGLHAPSPVEQRSPASASPWNHPVSLSASPELSASSFPVRFIYSVKFHTHAKSIAVLCRTTRATEYICRSAEPGNVRSACSERSARSHTDVQLVSGCELERALGQDA